MLAFIHSSFLPVDITVFFVHSEEIPLPARRRKKAQRAIMTLRKHSEWDFDIELFGAGRAVGTSVNLWITYLALAPLASPISDVIKKLIFVEATRMLSKVKRQPAGLLGIMMQSVLALALNHHFHLASLRPSHTALNWKLHEKLQIFQLFAFAFSLSISKQTRRKLNYRDCRFADSQKLGLRFFKMESTDTNEEGKDDGAA
jgi:hypothetical protein